MVVSIKTMRECTEQVKEQGTVKRRLCGTKTEDLDASASTSAEHSPNSCDSALVCVGPCRWRAGGEKRQMEMCILCLEEQEILPDGTAMVLAAFVQHSAVMSKNRKSPPHNPGKVMV
ncbi:hypothetical protein AMELA_G00293210 [Ameiurus melas]|uniref:Uncharacterized protein n=1 Tax=Ameiurus melas TaxID=219545 RepID=A0A7J5ZI28_AMEME|nr:hypothetical protein AMELA_G00293210 [Ameiurus melas]